MRRPTIQVKRCVPASMTASMKAVRRRAAYAGIKLSTTRALARNGWAAGIVIASLLMIPCPPTAQLGPWGWAAGIGIQVASAAGWLALRLRPAWFGFDVLLVVTWLLPVDVAAMQWLAGGWSAPYHELYLPALVLGSAGLPLRRFLPFAVAVTALALAPALYAPDGGALTGMLAELAVWTFVIGALSVLMERVRGQARLARSDVLTQLGNRRALEERFEVPRTGMLTLGIGDLDGFKQINDRHGHLAGDACLATVAQTLAGHARDGDHVFRWGGDEFAVLLPGTAEDAAPAIFERLEAAVAEHVRDPGGAPVRITFGWAGGDAGTDLRTLTARADATLLRRKPALRSTARW
jgi:diguanylate cyclase (GGDEF)-like protein